MKTFLSFSHEHGENSCVSGIGKYVKSVRIRSYSGAHYLVFGLNTERYGVSLRIQSKYGKMRTRITRERTLFAQWKVRLLLRDISFLYLRSSLKQVQGLIRGQISLGYERLASVMASKFDARNLEQEIESNTNFDHEDSLQQTLANVIIFILIKVYIFAGSNSCSRKKVVTFLFQGYLRA